MAAERGWALAAVGYLNAIGYAVLGAIPVRSRLAADRNGNEATAGAGLGAPTALRCGATGGTGRGASGIGLRQAISGSR